MNPLILPVMCQIDSLLFFQRDGFDIEKPKAHKKKISLYNFNYVFNFNN